MTRITRSPLSRAIRFAMTSFVLVAVAIAGCARPDRDTLSAAERAGMPDTLQRMIVSAYDITKPGDAVARMMSLYPTGGGVVSAGVEGA